MATRIPSEVTLAVQESIIWKVTIKQKGSDVFFGNGWRKFHQTYCVKSNDMLMFTYDRDSHFWVTIFDIDGNETDHYEDMIFQVKKSSDVTIRGSPRFGFTSSTMRVVKDQKKEQEINPNKQATSSIVIQSITRLVIRFILNIYRQSNDFLLLYLLSHPCSFFF